MTYTVHPGAESDIADASDFYKERASIAVARRFLAAIERRIAALRTGEAGDRAPCATRDT